MTWLLVLLVPINFSYNNAETLPKYSDEVQHTLFGDLSSMEDVLTAAKYTIEWNPNNTQSKGSSNSEWDPTDPKFGDGDIQFTEPGELDIDHSTHDYAGQQYHQLSKEIKVMRRQVTFNRDDTDDNEKDFWGREREKRWLFRRCYLQFIIHTRHEIAKALIQREPIRNDKRYKIGYLFNRLRRIRTEELKMLYYVHDRIRHRSMPWHHWFRHYNVFYVEDSFMTHLMIYERLTAYDVDLKDTIYLIKELYAVKAPYDFVEEEEVLPGAPTVRPAYTAPPGYSTESQFQSPDPSLKPGQGMAGMELQDS